MTSLAAALNNPESGQASMVSLSSSYQVPTRTGQLALASPYKFCLKYRPPTIAVVYTLDKSKKVSMGKPKKYIHEIRVDFEGCMADRNRLVPNKPTDSEISTMCKKICEAESTYLNIHIISKTQVLNLIMKLYEKKYSCLPPSSPKQEAAPKAAAATAKASKDDDDISDDYEDDFDLAEDKKEDEAKKPAKKDAESDDDKDSDWDLDELMNGGGKKADAKGEEKGIGSYVD